MKTVKNFEFTINGVTFDNFDFETISENPAHLLWKLTKAGCSEIHLQDEDYEDVYTLYTQTLN